MSEVHFAGYRIVETIGAGALSTIYKAVQEPLGRAVAIKALKPQIAPTSSFGEQLDRESKILADLVHPNVVLLLEASRTASGRPYLILEHVDGTSVHELLARFEPEGKARSGKKKNLDVPAALAIACGICSALEHIHERGVVHRDLKPSNILVSRSGVVKVIDFGIAQRPRIQSMSDALGTEGITATGRMAPEQIKDAFGTPAYMSPEQILGDFVDGRSDLFSLGVVLYQMLSGARPFETATGDDAKRTAAQRIRRDTPAPLRERAPQCPRSIERIVMRLLEKSPNDRYPSAGTVKERLEAALRAETREDPAWLVREALARAGVIEREAGSSDEAERRKTTGRTGAVARTSRRSMGVRRALLGFVGIAGVFAVAAASIEASNAHGREGRSAGSRALELIPDKSGGLRVLATPWAYVRVDGQLVETTPFARPVPLGAGRHWVTLSHPDAVANVEREIDIVAGETVTLDVTMNIESDGGGKDAR